MAAPPEQLGRNSATREHPQLYAEQIRLLYRNAPVGLIATLINSAVLVFILRNVVPHRALTIWLVSILLISIARFVQLTRFRRVPPESSDVGRWGTWFVIGLALSGIIWGSAGIFLYPVESTVHQEFLAFVLGGMAIGAVGAFSVVMIAFIAYTLPSLAPLIVRFLAAGDEIHLAMGGMSLLFVVLITGIALHINRVTLASLLLRFEKNSLVVYLSSAKNDLEKLNRELSLEIVERRKAEEELKRHREHLEELVDNRAGELVAANTKLEQEISERKKLQDLLSQGKKEWEETFDAINDAITIHDKDFNVIRANKAAEKILGLQFLKILGQKCYRLYHDSDSPPEDCASCMVLKTGEPSTVERFEPSLNKFIEIKAFPLFDEDNQIIKLVHIIRDVTERKRIEVKLQALSITDELTGLYNRRGFFTLADQQLKIAKRQKKGMFVLSADLDDLKGINDKYGHITGDRALIETADILKDSFRESDIISRIGGDEFVVLQIVDTATTSELPASRLHKNLEIYNTQKAHGYALSLSIGIAYCEPESTCSLDELIILSDKLMYEQKSHKRSQLGQSAEFNT